MKKFILFIFCFLVSSSIFTQNQPNLLQLTKHPENDYHPRWSKDGQTIAYTHNDGKKIDIFTISTKGGTPKILEMELNGDKHLSWSPDDSKIVFDAYLTNGPLSLFIIPVQGGDPKQITSKVGFHPVWSPDGKKIAFSNSDIWLYDLESNEYQQLTKHSANEFHPAWTPDGKSISFTSTKNENQDIWMISLDTKKLTQLTNDPAKEDWSNWKYDGSQIAFSSDRSGNYDIWTLSLRDNSLKQITFDESRDNHPEWSPDGKKIAFSSNRTGNLDIWIIELENQ